MSVCYCNKRKEEDWSNLTSSFSLWPAHICDDTYQYIHVSLSLLFLCAAIREINERWNWTLSRNKSDPFCCRKRFTQFCDTLIRNKPRVYLWGASMHHNIRPYCLEEVKLTIPLRSPPVVVREVMKADEMKTHKVHEYTDREVHVSTDGPTIRRIKHQEGQSGHKGILPRDCEECGHHVAHVLAELNVGQTGTSIMLEVVSL